MEAEDKLDPIEKQREEYFRIARGHEKKDRETAEMFQALVRNPGFVRYLEIINQMIEDRGSALLEPAGSIDGAVLSEYQKGTMKGLLLSRDLVPVTIDLMKAHSAGDGDDSEDSE